MMMFIFLVFMVVQLSLTLGILINMGAIINLIQELEFRRDE